MRYYHEPLRGNSNDFVFASTEDQNEPVCTRKA